MKLKQHSQTFGSALAPLIVLVLVNILPFVHGNQIINRKLKLPILRPVDFQRQLLVNKTLVPNVTISQQTGAQKRSDYEDYDYDSKTLFKSLIPKSPFKKKKPIKKFFRSWFEPEQEALKEESSQSTFYFTSPKTNAFQASKTVLKNGNIRHTTPAQSAQQQHLHHHHQSKLYRNNVVPPPKHPNFVNRAHYASYTPYYPSYSNAGSYNTHYNNNNGYRVANIQPQMPPQRPVQMQPPMQPQIQHAPAPAPAPAPQFAIGDPANGRGMTISFDDTDQQPSEPAYAQTNAQYSGQDTGEKSRGINLSFGRGGSGMSLNLGRGNGGGRGVSLSFGGGAGSGMSLNFGGNDDSQYKESSSSSYPAYSYSSSGGSDYGNGYGENNYGYSNNYYYPPKPLFSLVMPSNGKTVVEMNQHPPKLKMKINSSPKVKITTNTKDPLEKPNLEEEVIMEDIFGPPEPFDRPMKNETNNNNKNTTTSDLNDITSPFNNTMLPYPYPYYPYPHYYQYPYNYYYNYYQQYPANYYNYMNSTMMQSAFPVQQTMNPPREKKITYTQVASSSMVKPVSSQTQYITPKASMPRQYSMPSSSSASSMIPQGQYSSAISTYVQPPRTWTSVLTGKQPIRSQRRQPLTTTMIQQSQSLAPGLKVFEASSHKRSSASRNYQKDMLTLSSNSINSIGRQKPIKSMKRKHPKERMVMGESQQQPKYNTNNVVMAGNFSNPMAYYQYPYYGAGYSFFGNNTKNTYNGTYSWSPYNYYYNPYYMNYYNNYYKYAKKYYDSYYGNYTSSYYKKNRTSITGFSQNSFDYEQSKIFGHRMIKYPGGSTKEEKARVIFDIRPRLTIKNLNRTEQMMQDEELKKKKKDHIFKTHMEIIMDTTTVKPYYDYNKYYGYKYGPEVDDFGWTHESPYATTTTAKPKVISTTTTRRRISTTTEAPSSEASEEEEDNATTESSTEENDEDRSSTTTESENDVDSASGEVDEEISAEEPSSTASTTTTEDTSEGDEEGDSEGDEVIEGNEDSQEEPEDATTEETIKEEEDEGTREENDETTETTDEPEEEEAEEEETEREEAAKPPNTPAPVTVAPELIQAMIKALQEALGVTTTTPMPSISAEQESNEQIDERVPDDVSNENDIVPTTTEKIKPTTTTKPSKSMFENKFN